MTKISYVAACEDPGEGGLGILLDIHFRNGQILLLSLRSKREDPAFLSLFRNGILFCPETDGDSVYWQGGPRLSLREIMEMARGA